ncbi:MAG: PspC domain-containing protein, partial [Bacteroidota bacterium]
LDDVESLISTMGTTQDFQATIDVDEDLEATAASENSRKQTAGEDTGSEEGNKKLYRDLRRKLIAGVAAGIARYFRVDPIWIRILLISLVAFPFISWPLAGLSSLTLIAYIIFWIVLPKKEFEDDQQVKKLYRNPEEKILGGVSGGLASYFGIDKVAVRILFILGIFAAFIGPTLYLILWIITPEASSITEKLEMQGEPVTLSTIESNIKKELNEEDTAEGQESALVKILLFPFRLIAMIIKGISTVLSPFLKFIIEAIRVLFGGFVFAIGFFLIIGALISIISYFGGLGDTPVLHMDNFHGSASYLRGVIEDSTLIFGAAAAIIPALLLAMLGISIVSKKWVIKSYIGWPLLGIWLVSIVGFGIALPNNIDKFDKTDSFKETKEFTLANQTPMLRLNELYDDFSEVELRLRGHDSDDFKLVIEYEASGNTRREAIKNAKMVSYNVSLQDSVFYFDSNFTKTDPDYRFRFQNVDVIFYIPYNRPFQMDSELSEILENTLERTGYRYYQVDGNDWIFNDEGQLACLTCKSSNVSSRASTGKKESRASRKFSLNNYTGSTENINIAGFNSIEANGIFDIEIKQGNTFSVEAKGANRSMKKVNFYKSGDALVLEFNKGRSWFWKGRNQEKIGVIITMPELNSIDLSGTSSVYIRSFDIDDLSIDLSGAASLEGDVIAKEIDIEISGATKLTLRGTSDLLQVDLDGASRL